MRDKLTLYQSGALGISMSLYLICLVHCCMQRFQVYELAEGAADPLALLGLIRLVQHLATCCKIPSTEPVSIVIDSGTGTTAVGKERVSQNAV